MTSLVTNFNNLDTLFNTLWGPTTRNEPGDRTLRPRVDILENDREYLIRVDLPGVGKEDVNVELEKGNLIISARRTAEAAQDHKPIRVERLGTVKFLRSFSLGDDVDADKISGELKDGILEVKLAKQERSLPRRIQVS